MAPPRPVVFIDFHGTICHDLYWRSLPEAAQQPLQKFLFSENVRVVDDWMRGRLAAEEVNRLVAAELGLPYNEVWQTFVADCQTMHVAPAILAGIRQLRQHATTVLITGNMDSFTRFTVPALDLHGCFDAISNSSDEGRLKTDDGGALFIEYSDRFGTAIQHCVAIDDSEDACQTFAALGGTALQVTEPRSALYWIRSLLNGQDVSPPSETA